MSSGAVVQALTSALGGYIYPDYTMEVAPRNDVFVILRWGQQNVTPGIRKGPHTLTVWAHEPVENSTDYTRITEILRTVQETLENMSSDPGPDNIRVIDVAFQGDSGNQYDPGFKTITKNSAYRVLLA